MDKKTPVPSTNAEQNNQQNKQKPFRRRSLVDEDSEEGHQLRRFLMENRTTIGGSRRDD
jgi:hypothetical protein